MYITGRGVVEKGRKPNTWYITFYLGEKGPNGRYRRAPRKLVHGLKRDAKAALADYRAELEAMDAAGSPTDETTVVQYARKFHEERQMNSPLAYKRERLDIDYIGRLLGDVALRDLDAPTIRTAYASERKRRERGARDALTENGLYKAHVKLRQILKQAYQDGIIPSNPCDLVEVKKPKGEERSPLSPEEARRFRELVLGQLAEDPSSKVLMCLLVLETGMRRGEALGLTWAKVDFEAGEIEVSAQFTNDKTLRPPKSEESNRPLAMGKTLIDVMRRWREDQRRLLAERGIEVEDDTPVVTGRDGGHLDPNNFDRWFRNFCVDNGFGTYTHDVVRRVYGGKEYVRGRGYVGLKPHELRHTNATIMIASNVDIKTVQHRLGHAQASTTMDIYAHVLKDNGRKAAEAFDKLFEG